MLSGIQLFTCKEGAPVTNQRVERTNSFSAILPLAAIWLVSMVATGCATSKDVDALRVEMNDQVATIRSDAAQTRQGVEAVKVDAAQTRRDVEALKADVVQVKSLGVAINSLKSRLDSVQSTVQGLQMEAGTQRTTLMHQLQAEVTLARERIRQAEELIDQLQKGALAASSQERGATPRN
jgi:outer membrane murein-binding lipoprotein Lpp